jgi:hypothetical protein
LLRTRRERSRDRHAAEERDELAASHLPFKIAGQKFFCSTYEPLWPPGEYNGDWARILDHLACGSEHPRRSVYSKCDNPVAQLVGRVEKAPCRVETNEAWDAALRGLPSNRGKQSVSRIGGVHSHAVVATIGAIHKATVRRDRDFAGGSIHPSTPCELARSRPAERPSCRPIRPTRGAISRPFPTKRGASPCWLSKSARSEALSDGGLVNKLAGAAFNADIGVKLPADVALQPVPPDLANNVPQTKGYYYAVTQDRVLLVSPENRTVVGVFAENKAR